MYVDLYRVIITVASNSRYYGRVSFVGNLTAGHAWFKLSNLTIQDSNDYAIEIRGQDHSQELHTTSLIVLGKTVMCGITSYNRFLINFNIWRSLPDSDM